MPLYTITTQVGVLSGQAKARLADQLTTLHSERSGVPKNWVHIVFQDYPTGSGFTAGQPAATVALTVVRVARAFVVPLALVSTPEDAPSTSTVP